MIVSDLWAAYPDALRQVWPRAERQVCWFHVMQWTTRKLSELLKRHGERLPEAERKALNCLRSRLLACPDKQARLDERGRTPKSVVPSDGLRGSPQLPTRRSGPRSSARWSKSRKPARQFCRAPPLDIPY